MDTVVPLPSAPALARPAARGVSRHRIAAWLIGVCALVFVMVVVGGVTRLTRSGLSITEWAPIAGTLPPLNDADWATQVARYPQTPAYLKVNAGMTLAEFKGIFWWEYVHRLLGRLIGLAFLLPLLWFAVRGRIERALLPRLAAIFALGGVQGAIGWWMVSSGLVDTPRVSHVRLAVHLGTAFLIFAAMWWTALDLLAPASPPALAPERRRAARRATALAVLVFAMVLSGALVAGTRAGLVYNSFPLMDGHVVPPGLFALDPWWDSLLHDLTTVQFDHRMLAWLLMFVIPAFWWSLRRIALPPAVRRPANLMLAMLGVQVLLGVSTLMLHVPVALGAAHQGGALLLFALTLWTAHALRRG
ncbi:MAG: COX15/CtaA family protein [Burkholderiales bacterium]|nr:COX15/CtaA family protein [Burkholderiales bacterium]